MDFSEANEIAKALIQSKVAVIGEQPPLIKPETRVSVITNHNLRDLTYLIVYEGLANYDMGRNDEWTTVRTTIRLAGFPYSELTPHHPFYYRLDLTTVWPFANSSSSTVAGSLDFSGREIKSMGTLIGTSIRVGLQKEPGDGSFEGVLKNIEWNTTRGNHLFTVEFPSPAEIGDRLLLGRNPLNQMLKKA